jgi:hypothetical protein
MNNQLTKCEYYNRLNIIYLSHPPHLQAIFNHITALTGTDKTIQRVKQVIQYNQCNFYF